MCPLSFQVVVSNKLPERGGGRKEGGERERVSEEGGEGRWRCGNAATERGEKCYICMQVEPMKRIQYTRTPHTHCIRQKHDKANRRRIEEKKGVNLLKPIELTERCRKRE